ncbi:hypothetical protein ADUPG1_005686, partial [Aduncisulcus paluster]
MDTGSNTNTSDISVTGDIVFSCGSAIIYADLFHCRSLYMTTTTNLDAVSLSSSNSTILDLGGSVNVTGNISGYLVQITHSSGTVNITSITSDSSLSISSTSGSLSS